MMNHWVFRTNPEGKDAVYLGVQLAHKYARDDVGGEPIRKPTAEEVEEVQKYLEHLGLADNVLETHLLICCW